MNLEDVADLLYGLRPEEFTATRNERASAAKKDGDRELAGRITALRRPSLSAWASNLLVRERPNEVQPLIALGQQLRRAHQDLDGEELRELSRQQRLLVGTLARQARQLAAEAGHRLGDDAQHEIEETLRAVLADPDAATAWAEGRLTKPLKGPTGFPGVAPGATPTPPRPVAAAPKPFVGRAEPDGAGEHRRQQLEHARQDAKEAEEALRGRQEEAERAERDAHDAATEAERFEGRVTELGEQLKQVQEEQSQSQHRARQAEGRARETDRAVRAARRRAEAAAARVERLASRDPKTPA